MVVIGEAFEADERLAGFDRSGAAGRDSTVFFEQIGQSAVKRLWRQKSELIGDSKIRACQHDASC